MIGRQRIDRVRREYNQWVANQTLEDFALRFTAKSARRWSSAWVGNTALGGISFLALEAIGASVTLNYGYVNATMAILVVGCIIFATAAPICISAAKYGVDIDLLTRGAGFGYIGSTITSLIYASFTFIFFAIESVILAMALDLCLGIPRPIGYLVSALAVIPLVTHGIAAISRFQVWTQPLWIALNVAPIAMILLRDPHALGDWQAFAGSQNADGGFHLALFGAAASVTIALIVQVGEQVDFLRFLPDRDKGRRAWWMALLSAGPGWIVVGSLKLLAGSFLAVYALRHGVSAADAGDPPQMYAAGFQSFIGSRSGALAVTCVFVIVCQLKINVTNAYAGSIAWSNFFSRLTHSHPGRVVWLIFNVLVALLVMELGVYRALEQTLAVYSSVAVAWVGALVGDLVIAKPLGLSPPTIEFKRAHLYDVNPVGVGAMAIAAIVSALSLFGLFGETARSLSPFLALAVSILCVPCLALLTGSRFYLAREARTDWRGAKTVRCCICEHAFETEDMASCPAYAGPICSLCCSLDARCHDMCKPQARLHDQVATGLSALMPRRLQHMIMPHVVEYVLAFGLSILLIVFTLGLIGMQLTADHRIDPAIIAETLWKVFFSLLIVVAVVSWLFGLVQVSRRAAQSETLRQTQLLMDEIDAHERTDAALKRAKEVAEAANFAKSRYVVGLSHELRTPLNTIMGYAQLLERDQTMTQKPRRQVAVMRRSANHLSGLIDGLLDISKIEAGRLDLSRDEVLVKEFLTQIVDMFAVQAASKGIDFTFALAPDMPGAVAMDEKRLRQILINLLSNAIKFTQSGTVALRIAYRNQVAEFCIEDTGPGIAPDDLDRIFEPFERLRTAASPEAGTGLGLTICRLLAGVMGGDITVSSRLGVGSAFTLRLFLPRINDPKRPAAGTSLLNAPLGRGRTILIVDDDPAHRDMVREALAPLDFDILCAQDGATCLDVAETMRPDLFLLDIEMPGGDGWQLAERLRGLGHAQAKIVMLSASAIEEYRSAIALPFHDAFIMKPVDIQRLTETIVTLLGLHAKDERVSPPCGRRIDEATLALPDVRFLHDLVRHCEIGYLRGLRSTLADVEASDPAARDFVDYIGGFVDAVDMRGLMAAIERLSATA